jgi:hypothetical protein
MKPETTTVMVIPMQWYTPPHYIWKKLMHLADIAMDMLAAIAVIGAFLLLMLSQASRMLQNIIWWMTGWI